MKLFRILLCVVTAVTVTLKPRTMRVNVITTIEKNYFNLISELKLPIGDAKPRDFLFGPIRTNLEINQVITIAKLCLKSVRDDVDRMIEGQDYVKVGSVFHPDFVGIAKNIAFNLSPSKKNREELLTRRLEFTKEDLVERIDHYLTAKNYTLDNNEDAHSLVLFAEKELEEESMSFANKAVKI